MSEMGNFIDVGLDVGNLDVSEENVSGVQPEPSLSVLKDLHKMYEDRLQLIRTRGEGNKLKLENNLLHKWVKDVVEQNDMLVLVVEKLETELVKRIHMLKQRADLEQRQHSDIVCELRTEQALLRAHMARKDSDQRGLVELLRRLRELDDWSGEGIHFYEVSKTDIYGSPEWRKQNTKEQGDKENTLRQRNVKWDTLQDTHELKIKNDALEKENMSKDREINKLNEDLQQLRRQISQPICASMRDVDVSVRLCCPDTKCGDVERNRDYSLLLNEESDKYEANMKQLEDSLKSSVQSQRMLRHNNVELSEEVTTLRRVCCTLDEQCRTQSTRSKFKDEIIREMRKQLKHAKAKLIDEATALSHFHGSHSTSAEFDSAHDVHPYAVRRDTKSLDCGPLDRGDIPKTSKQPKTSRERASNGGGDKISTARSSK